MKHILVVCGAGASSTFLAHRMRQAAKARGFETTVKAVSQAAIDSRMPGVDVLLVGPHLAAELSVLTGIAAGYNAPAALLPDTVFGAGGEDVALDIALEALRASDHPTSTLATTTAPTTTENIS
ncbi:PTS sugar transporter subunit IIB [Subtercola boreus]|uniref:PTS sugar transporter subunit IIB n=1 Tax=Subtercola boreus TaxID=120213 RepID=UPI00116A153F|nr:PTS sugar transporter subunit IIB [Subtercola boreus]TQL52776.1 PTS system cellobiose-specific IIB component [Subtercola boreus]